MADEEVGDPEVRAQIGEEIEDLGPYRDVEGGGRLVQHHEVRPGRERPRDADPLLLPGAELVGVAVHRARSEAHEVEDLGDAFLPLRRTDRAGALQGLLHDRADPHPRAERIVGLLEHHLDAGPEGPERSRIHREHVPPVEPDRARGRLNEAKDAAPGGRLPRSALAHEGKGFARPDLERHIVDGLHLPAPVHREVLDQALDGEERLRHQTATSPFAIAAALRQRTQRPVAGSEGSGTDAAHAGSASGQRGA